MNVKNRLSKFLPALFLSLSSFAVLAQNTPGTQVMASAVDPGVRALFEQGALLYPDLFAQPSQWFMHEGYTYRYFAGSGVYAGVKDGKLYMKGGVFGNSVQESALGDMRAMLDSLMLYEEADVPHGNVGTHAYRSSALGTDRQFYVYTPPGYDDDGEPYPVLYLLHGAGSTENSWTQRGLVDVIMDNLIAAEAIEPFVIIMPYGYAYPPGPNDRTDPVKLREQRSGFNADFLNDVIPQAEASFNISTEQSGRAIAGLSLGGAQALALGLSHPELFSRVAAFSPAMGATNNPETGGVDYSQLFQDEARLNRSMQLVWLGSGIDDTLFASIENFDRQMSDHGIEHIFRVTQGAHTWEVWRRYFHEVAAELFAPDRF